VRHVRRRTGRASQAARVLITTRGYRATTIAEIGRPAMRRHHPGLVGRKRNCRELRARSRAPPSTLPARAATSRQVAQSPTLHEKLRHLRRRRMRHPRPDGADDVALRDAPRPTTSTASGGRSIGALGTPTWRARSRGPLRIGLSIDEAADRLDRQRELIRPPRNERGWTLEAYERWLADIWCTSA
jgi:hypothetical protein